MTPSWLLRWPDFSARRRAHIVTDSSFLLPFQGTNILSQCGACVRGQSLCHCVLSSFPLITLDSASNPYSLSFIWLAFPPKKINLCCLQASYQLCDLCNVFNIGAWKDSCVHRPAGRMEWWAPLMQPQLSSFQDQSFPLILSCRLPVWLFWKKSQHKIIP